MVRVRALPELQGGLNIKSYHFGIRRAQGLMACRAFVSDFLEEHVPWLVSLQRELEEQPSVVSWLESSFTSHPTHKGRFVDKSKPHEIRAEALAIVAESGHATLINSNRTAEKPGVWLPLHSLVLHVGYTGSVEFGTNRCVGTSICFTF